MEDSSVLIVGIGGSTRQGSGSERALRAGLAAAEQLGARTVCLAGGDLAVPFYGSQGAHRGPRERRLVELMGQAEGLLIAGPAYHGTMSGLMKNALDYAEDLRERPEPYFSGRPVGCVTVAAGAQGAASALASLRATVHALRGWPTPLGVTIDTSAVDFGEDGRCLDPRIQLQLEITAGHLVEFAREHAASRAPDLAHEMA